MTYEQAKQILDNIDKVPYPKLQNVVKNPLYARSLYDDFSGDMGELSAITQYVYEHIDNNDDQNISRIMLSVAIVEMRHLDIVGSLIKKLGLPPHYVNSGLTNWNSTYVKYNTGDIKETMKYNIYTEKKAIEGYRKAIRRTNNISIKRLLNRIIMDEKTHIEIFTRIMKENENK